MKTLRERINERIAQQGEKLDRKYEGRPISREKYERIMSIVAGVVIAYLAFSLMCVIKVLGEWIMGG